MLRYLECAKATTGFLALPDNSALWSGEFARISYIQLKIDIESACKRRDSMINGTKGMECYNSSNTEGPHLSGLWQQFPNRTDGYTEIAVLKIPNGTLEELQEKLNVLNGTDRTFIDRFALGIKLQMVAFDRLGQDGAYFSFEVRFADEENKSIKQIASSTISSPHTPQHIIWGVLFIIGNLVFTLNEVAVWRLTYLQVRHAGCVQGGRQVGVATGSSCKGERGGGGK
jgi:hypothetical protein